MSAEKVIQIAKEEVGYLEKATNANLDSKTGNAGYNNYTKYARDLYNAGYYNGNKNGYAWCDVFVDWCFYKAYGSKVKAELVQCQTGDLGAGCVYSAGYYKAQSRYDKTPKVGDQIFFYDAAGDINHTGLVYAVTDSTVYTIEGNTSSASGVVANGGCVAMKSYSRSYSRIAGYGHPKYEAVAESTAPSYKVGWNQNATGWWYVHQDGSYTTDGWEQIDGQWYYFDERGYMVHDTTVEYGGKIYTFDSNGHVTVTEKPAEKAENNAIDKEDDEMRYETLKDVNNARYRQALDKLIDKGILAGKGGSGEDMILDLGEDTVRVLVILDRAGVFDK